MNYIKREGNKCEKLGFVHSWEDTTPNVVYPTYPPQYPNKSERCENCGLERELIVIQPEVKGWKIK